MGRTAVLRTSDRTSFKGCRRRWNWQSNLRQNLEPKQGQNALWFGTGIHFALEEYFDPTCDRPWKARPSEAFQAYVKATQIVGRQEMPPDWEELSEMGIAILDYFVDSWLPLRDPLKTYVHDGIPQLEVNFQIDVPFDVKAMYPDSPYDNVVYSGTMDRVTIDENGLLWIVDYKTAKVMKASHFANDPQVTAYCWAASQLYGREVGGLIYWQFAKVVPKQPEPLVSGKISTAQNQRTTRPLYKKALVDYYGSVEKAPSANIQFLNQLAMQESPDQDAYIRRDRIWKNRRSLEAEGAKILMELEDILNPNLQLYPNPTFMCPSTCAFYEVCVSMDDGSDWEEQLQMETIQRAGSDESWRRGLPKAIELMYGKKDRIDFDNL